MHLFLHPSFVVGTELLGSKKKSDQLQALSKCCAYLMTGEFVSFMKENSLPLRVVEAVRTRTIKWIRHTMQPGAIARTADSDDPAPNNRDLSFKLKGGTSTRDRVLSFTQEPMWIGLR